MLSGRHSLKLGDFVIGPLIAKGCSAVVYAARTKTPSEKESHPGLVIKDAPKNDPTAYPLAMKMMFNYHAESNSIAILRAMHREIVPAMKRVKSEDIEEWENQLSRNVNSLPPHPNIVAMYNVFTDAIPPALPDSSLFPDALPVRLNPTGSGRNMSLFLLMKRFEEN